MRPHYFCPVTCDHTTFVLLHAITLLLSCYTQELHCPCCDWRENVKVSWSCCSFFRAAQATALSDPGHVYNIIIIVIIIAFKGAIRDFLQSPHSAANCIQHVRSSGPGAIVCKSRATHRALITGKFHVACHLVRRGSSATKFDRVEIAFI